MPIFIIKIIKQYLFFESLLFPIEYNALFLFLSNCYKFQTMKESRNLLQNHIPGNLTDKNQGGQNKSNIGSLKAILNQGRVPLSQYINQKSFKCQNNNQNLSYFDKLKAMFNKGGEIKTLRKNQKSNDLQMDVQQYNKNVDLDQNCKFNTYLNNFTNNKVNNYHKKKIDANERYKERSKSMNGKSRPKIQNIQRIQTLSSKMKKMDIECTEKTHQKAHTQHQIQQQNIKNIPVLVSKFKALKKQVINYTKLTAIYINDSLQNGTIELEQTLGCGANAIVRIGKQRKTEKLFAIKIYEKYKLIQPIKKKRVLREIQILSKIDHESIIRICNCYQDKRQIHILFQFIPNAQTLQDFLRNNLHEVSLSLKNHISLKIVEAISYLHNNGISHRDIKTDNVMIGENGLVKLIDFGFATTVAKGETHCGTPNYMAPQLFSKKSIYNPFKVDVWALGILLYYLHEGCYPFRGYNQKQLSRNICSGDFSFKKCDIKMREIITSILKSDANCRLSADQILVLIKNITNF